VDVTPSLRGRFDQLAADLRDDPRIEVTAAELPGPASDADIAAAADALGGPPPAALARLYSELDGVTLRWQLRDADDRGSIELLPLAELVKDWRGVTWFDDGDEYRGVRPWDFFAPEACAALVDADGGGLRATVSYHYLGELLCDTGHGIDAFLDRLIAARGYWYWIEALCPAMRESPEAQRFLARMPELFDDFDAGLFALAD